MSALSIGYIGLGSLGSAIFPNLAQYAKENSLPPPIIWNRSPDKYAPITEAHPEVQTAKEVGELVDKCSVIFSCLVDDHAAEDVYDKLVLALEGRKAGTANAEKIVFADQTTLKAGTALKIKEKVEKAGGVYLTTTVFGQPPAARARQLVVVSSGDPQGREKVRPLLESIGKKVIDVGNDNAKGAALKLLGNSVLLGAIQLYSEVYALADAIDFDLSVFHELHKNLFAAPALLNYSNKISQSAFGDAGFTVKTGLKDAGHILSLGEDLGHPTPLPTVERARQNLLKVQELGGGALDWSALSSAVRVDAGLPPFREGTDDGKKRAD